MHGSLQRSTRKKPVFFTLGGLAFVAALLLGGLPAAYARSAVEIAGSSFKSTFTNNTAGWAVMGGTWKKTGSGYYRGTSTAPDVVGSVVHNDTYDHFSLTARVKGGAALGGSFNYIFVRGDPEPLGYLDMWDDGYYFVWNNGGLFGVFKRIAGSDTVLKSVTATSAIVPYGWNVLRVDMSTTYMAFFINNQLVYAGSDASLSSGQLGLGFNAASAGETFNIDYVKVKVVTP